MSRTGLVFCLAVVLISEGSSLNAAKPELVSPGGPQVVSDTRGSCPTFSWGASADTLRIELSIYRWSEAPDDLPAEISPESTIEPVAKVGLPGSARSWTPGGEACLADGGVYAWMVQSVAGDGSEEWSEARLFRVMTDPRAEGAGVGARGERRNRAPEEARSLVDAQGREGEVADGRGAGGGFPETAAVAPGELPRSGSDAAAPSLGDAALTLDSQLHLGAAGDIFKDGFVFSWSDTAARNLSLGENALLSNTAGVSNTAVGNSALVFTTVGSHNTAVGDNALRNNTTGIRNTAVGHFSLRSNTLGGANTAVGHLALDAMNGSFYNTAVGSEALLSLTSGHKNTAVGEDALLSLTTGHYNTAVGENAARSSTTGSRNTALGQGALIANTTGSRNIAVGTGAGYYSTGSGNIMIGSSGFAGESNTLRIAAVVGGGGLERAFIDGIRNASGSFDQAVCTKSGDQLGPCSSSSARFKEDVEEMGSASAGVLALRPVRYRYSREFAGDDAETLHYGLIAEEVARLFPHLVTYDDSGRAATVRYEALTPLLLNEFQRVEAEREALLERLARLETLVAELAEPARTQFRN